VGERKHWRRFSTENQKQKHLGFRASVLPYLDASADEMSMSLDQLQITNNNPLQEAMWN
jgi:hypothetical protein